MKQKDKDRPATGMTIHTPKELILEMSKDCDMCGSCCRFGSGFVLENEIPVIAGHLGHDIKSFKENFLQETEIFNKKVWKFNTINNHDKPYGPCIFLDGKICKIHDIKPLHCRIGTCKEFGDEANTWFMINHFVDKDDPESIRQYHAYIKTGGRVLKGAELEKFVPEKTRLRHMLEYRILK